LVHLRWRVHWLLIAALPPTQNTLMKPLSGLDGAFLHLETPQTPMHVASLHVFELPKGYRGDFHADIKRQMQRRLHLAPVLQRKLAPMPLQFANPVWVDDDAVDLDYHVQRATLPPPGGQAELEDFAASVHGGLLDRARPLWRLYVIDGLASGQAGYYIKVHHAVLDGQAGVLLAQALFDITAKPRTASRRGHGIAAEHPGMGQLAAAALKHDAAQIVKFVRHLPNVVRTLAGLFGSDSGGSERRAGMAQNFSFGPHTALNVAITSERTFAGLSLPMKALQQLAAVHDAKLNDIVLALCSGALRRYLARHGGVPKKPLIAAMPISLRATDNTEFSTQATMTLVNLHTHRTAAVQRLIAIRDAAGAAKALAGRTKSILPTDFPSIAVPWLLHGLATLYGWSGLADRIVPIANVVISNVPGPQVPLYAAGARMCTYWPLSIPEHGLGLNITVMSYAGAMCFGFTAARAAVADARPIAHALAEAFDELVAQSKPRAQRNTAAHKSAPHAAAKPGRRALR
jgi:diacylglycerol O-acyltransferase / wax synthase